MPPVRSARHFSNRSTIYDDFRRTISDINNPFTRWISAHMNQSLQEFHNLVELSRESFDRYENTFGRDFFDSDRDESAADASDAEDEPTETVAEGASLPKIGEFIIIEKDELDPETRQGKIFESADCTVCMSEPSVVILYPCRHKVLCVDCAKSITTNECPMCRTLCIFVGVE